MSILEEMGLTEKSYEEATGSAVSAAFEVLESGAYKATIKEASIYMQQYEGKDTSLALHVVVNLTDSDRDVSFRSDVAAKLKDGTENIGYASRLKQLAYAAGVSLDALSLKEGHKVKSFGKEHDAKLIQGLAGKTVIALVRHSEDTEKAEGEPYKFSNDIEGLAAANGTDASGEDVVKKFNEKVEKTPIFKIKGKSKKTGNTPAAAAPLSDAAKADAKNMLL